MTVITDTAAAAILQNAHNYFQFSDHKDHWFIGLTEGLNRCNGEYKLEVVKKKFNTYTLKVKANGATFTMHKVNERLALNIKELIESI